MNLDIKKWLPSSSRPQTNKSSKIRYRAEIDGLRAIAVIPVILFHSGFELFSGGYVGVDVFFVISGYLITSIITAEMANNRFSIAKFYERRSRRILPALFFIIICCIPFAWIWLPPDEMIDFANSLLAVLTFSSNIYFWQHIDYFTPAAELRPLLHTWSLAVEEQYYIFYPVFLMIAWRFGKRFIVGTLFVAIIISLLVANWGAYHSPVATFYLLPTRAWELLIGSVVALIFNAREPAQPTGFIGNSLSTIGLFAILYSAIMYDSQTPFPSLFALAPVVGTALIIIYAHPGTLTCTILKNPILVSIGLISYSAYLWHFPITAFIKLKYTIQSSYLLMSIAPILSLIFAIFSWKYIEMPARSPNRFGVKRFFSIISFAAICLVAFGALGNLSDGFEKQRLSKERLAAYNVLQEQTGYTLNKAMIDNGDCHYWVSSIDEKSVERYNKCSQKYGKGILVIGDSHAMNLYNAVAKANYSPFVFGISDGGCRPQQILPQCKYGELKAFIRSNKDKIRYILFHQSGSYFVADRYDHVDSSLSFIGDEAYSFREDYILTAMDFVSDLNTIVRTYWVGPFVEARFHSADLYKMAWQDAFRINPKSIMIFKQLETKIHQTIEHHQDDHKVNYISLVDLMDVDVDSLKVGDCITYMDQDHLSKCGEQLLADTIKEQLEALE